MGEKFQYLLYENQTNPISLRGLKTLHADTVRKIRAGWTPNYTAHPNTENLKSITLYFLPPNTASCLQPVDQGVIRSLKCKYRTRIIKTIIHAIDNGKQMPSISILEAMKMLAHSWGEVSESTVINCFRKAGFKEGVSDEDDDTLSAFESSTDQLRQRDVNVIPTEFTYKEILTVDDDIAVMGGVMTDEKIVQDLIEVAEEEVHEEDEEVTDETITKRTTEEICKAIDTLVNFSNFTQSGEIGTIALKAAKLFEKELCESMKQTFQTFARKMTFDKAILYRILHVLIFLY